MGASKLDFFSDEQNELTKLFKAISHPSRVAIIQYLLTVDTLFVAILSTFCL